MKKKKEAEEAENEVKDENEGEDDQLTNPAATLCMKMNYWTGKLNKRWKPWKEEGKHSPSEYEKIQFILYNIYSSLKNFSN